MNKERSKTQITTAKSSHHEISYENAMKFARQNELANSWASNNPYDISFIEHLVEINGIIDSELKKRIKESKREKAQKKYSNGASSKGFDLLPEDEI